MNYQKFTMWKKTKEDWYPTKDGNLEVIVSFLIPDSLKLIRISVWGGDDFGMEKDIEVKKIDNKTMLKWIRYAQNLSEPIKKKQLEKIGFKRC